eukprot:1344439-Rhodomonas_salina.1
MVRRDAKRRAQRTQWKGSGNEWQRGGRERGRRRGRSGRSGRAGGRRRKVRNRERLRGSGRTAWAGCLQRKSPSPSRSSGNTHRQHCVWDTDDAGDTSALLSIAARACLVSQFLSSGPGNACHLRTRHRSN